MSSAASFLEPSSYQDISTFEHLEEPVHTDIWPASQHHLAFHSSLPSPGSCARCSHNPPSAAQYISRYDHLVEYRCILTCNQRPRPIPTFLSNLPLPSPSLPIPYPPGPKANSQKANVHSQAKPSSIKGKRKKRVHSRILSLVYVGQLTVRTQGPLSLSPPLVRRLSQKLHFNRAIPLRPSYANQPYRCNIELPHPQYLHRTTGP